MKPVKIADLKAHLSEHLRYVQQGKSIVVLDRTTPIARLVPLESKADGLVVRQPRSKTPVGKIKMPRPAKLDFDIVDLLLDERQS